MISCLHDLVSDAAGKRPRSKAVIEADTGRSITYQKLDKKVKAIADEILRKGLKKGERVGILSRNSISCVAVYFAVSRSGGISVPLNHTLDWRDIVREADNCRIRAIYAGKDLKKKAKNVKKKVKSVRFTIRDNPPSAKIAKLPRVLQNDPASIIYTSGTAKVPIGVMLSHRNLISNSKSVIKYAKITSSDRICCVLPFYYIYGLSLLFSPFLAGGTIILDNRFMYPNVVLGTIERFKATGFAGVSSHYSILLHKSEIGKRALASLRYFMQAGDAMPPGITRELINTFPGKKLYLMYGQTEASPRLTYLDPSLAAKKPDSIGKAIPGVKVRIVNNKNKPCKPGEKGEILALGKNIMLGYWGKNRETGRVIKKGWLHTGDIAFRDEDGDIFIAGRKKDFIKVGGRRVNPREIEYLITEDERVMEAAVIGVPDKILGERIKIFVTLMHGQAMSREEIRQICKERLPPYKMPSRIAMVKIMPRNSYGKIDKEGLKSK
ncbi:MAG: class I adenylate-forming enzyme family protein [Candidatus Omnitrophota bacterium]